MNDANIGLLCGCGFLVLYLAVGLIQTLFPCSPAEQWSRRTLGSRVTTACLLLALIAIGGFSVRQGIVLWLLLVGLSDAIRDAAYRPARFHPYGVSVEPDWYAILTDLKLINDPEEWRSLTESFKSNPAYDPLRDGVQFTVIQQGGNKPEFPRSNWQSEIGWQEVGDFDAGMNDAHPPLIFWNRSYYGAEFRFEHRFSDAQKPLCLETEEPSGRRLPASFFIKLRTIHTENKRGPKYRPEVLGGLDLGIEVSAKWWDTKKHSCTAPIQMADESRHPFSTPTVYLSLATLPLSEFNFYRGGDRALYTYYDPLLWKRLQERRDQNRRTFGWTAWECPVEMMHTPEVVKHKYFRVQHQMLH